MYMSKKTNKQTKHYCSPCPSHAHLSDQHRPISRSIYLLFGIPPTLTTTRTDVPLTLLTNTLPHPLSATVPWKGAGRREDVGSSWGPGTAPPGWPSPPLAGKDPLPRPGGEAPPTGGCPQTRSDKRPGAPPDFQGRSAGGGARAHLSQPAGRSASSSSDTREGGREGSEEAAVAAAAGVAHAGSGLHVSTSLRLGLRLDSGSAPAPAASARRPGGGERRGKRPRTRLGTERPGAPRPTVTWRAAAQASGKCSPSDVRRFSTHLARVQGNRKATWQIREAARPTYRLLDRLARSTCSGGLTLLRPLFIPTG